ncbi:MAG TPA: transposase [Pseudobdellovibrionaceae bacterium]|nr:transposase [Pseudobdellovibrionaceae bacterium]
MKAALNLPYSARTIRRIIKASGIIIYKKRSSKFILTGLQRANREAWANQKLHWTEQWKKVVFSDEKKFNLDGPDGNSMYCHDIRKPELQQNKRHSGGGGVMIWAAIGWRGKSQVAFLEGNQNSEKYLNTLEHYLLPCGAQIGGRNWIFMQDNASIHSSRATTAWLEQRHIRVLQWPAKSPDLNIIENVWAVMSSIVYKDGKQYDNVRDLKVGILAAWAQISGEYRRKLFNSIQNRLIDVINMNGAITKY